MFARGIDHEGGIHLEHLRRRRRRRRRLAFASATACSAKRGQGGLRRPVCRIVLDARLELGFASLLLGKSAAARPVGSRVRAAAVTGASRCSSSSSSSSRSSSLGCSRDDGCANERAAGSCCVYAGNESLTGFLGGGFLFFCQYSPRLRLVQPREGRFHALRSRPCSRRQSSWRQTVWLARRRPAPP